MCRAMMLLAVLPAVVCAACESHTLPWLYYDYDSRGPKDWATVDPEYATCGSGAKQSPINIRGAEVNTALKPLEFHYKTVPPQRYTILNIQKSIEVQFDQSPGYMIDPNSKKRYNVLQLHFHSPSEHGIAGGRYPLEMHIVHTADDPDDEHQLAVVGVMFSFGMHNTQLNAIWRHLPDIPMPQFDHWDNASATFQYNEARSAAPLEMVVPGEAFFTYSGSLTTPPCTEGVKWFVMQDAAQISEAQVTAFRSSLKLEEEMQMAAAEKGVVLEAFEDYGDARPLMPVNGRKVESYAGARAASLGCRFL